MIRSNPERVIPMSEIEPHTIPFRTNQVVWQESDKDIIIRSTRNGTEYSVQNVGADIWLVCDGENSFADIVELLLAAYEVDRDTLQRDLTIFLTDLQTKGLINFK